jgi:hypothetical protein
VAFFFESNADQVAETVVAALSRHGGKGRQRGVRSINLIR